MGSLVDVSDPKPSSPVRALRRTAATEMAYAELLEVAHLHSGIRIRVSLISRGIVRGRTHPVK